MKHSDGMCASCGGVVDEHGLAPLGEAEEFEPIEGVDTDQHEAVERMRGRGYADAVRRYAEGGMVEKEPLDAMAKSSDKMLDDSIGPADAMKAAAAEMKRRKAERYGFGRGR